MSYVYKITNDINGKMYIGQTNRTLAERFSEHLNEVKMSRSIGRPLYDAMRKYGVNHFHIEQIEETNVPKERETYWIEYYGTFKNGYNATFGGDGKRYIDYDLVIETYKKVGNMIETANKLGICVDSVSDILDIKNEDRRSITDIMTDKYGKMVSMFDLNGVYLKTFATAYDAGRYLIQNKLTNCKLNTIRTHIVEVCNGKRKSAASFIWSY